MGDTESGCSCTGVVDLNYLRQIILIFSCDLARRGPPTCRSSISLTTGPKHAAKDLNVRLVLEV